MSMFNQTLSHLPYKPSPDDVKKSLNQLLETFKSQFAQDETSIGTTYLTKIQIDMGDPAQRPYPIAMKHYD